jgi:hypothetical protein
MQKPKCTREVRELLVELDGAFEQFHRLNGVVADHRTDDVNARDTGAELEFTKRKIIGIAWRINKASKGEK